MSARGRRGQIPVVGMAESRNGSDVKQGIAGLSGAGGRFCRRTTQRPISGGFPRAGGSDGGIEDGRCTTDGKTR